MLAPEVDQFLYLQGDEDCDVSVQCRGCDKGGEPVIFYTRFGKNPYDEQRVSTARTIADLLSLMNRHVREVHDAPTERSVKVRLVGAS
jgi:hypothetical protein